MSAPTKGSGLAWVGRSIRRVEDPALLTGRGRFTADLPAAHRVRFVRSAVAAGRIEKINIPEGATVLTAADLAAVKPITPTLHKFGYVPIAQPILASGFVRFVGEPIAAVVAATEAEAEDIADGVAVEITEIEPVDRRARGARRRRAAGSRQAARNIVVEGKIETPGFAAVRDSAPAWSPSTSARGGRTRRRSRRAPATPRSIRFRAGDADLRDANAASDAHRDCRPDRHAGKRTARHCARCRRRLRPENVARSRVCRPGLARAKAQKLGRLDRGPPRESDGVVSQPRSVYPPPRRVRCRRETRRAVGRSDRQCRRLFVLSDHLRGRAADGDGRAAWPLRRARLFLRRARRAHQYLPDGALSRRVAPGHHAGAGAADGRRRRAIRPGAGRDSPPQPDRRNFPTPRRPAWCSTKRAIGRRSTWRAKRSTCRRSANARGRRARNGVISASALRRSPSVPATARRPSRRAAWASRPAGRRSS